MRRGLLRGVIGFLLLLTVMVACVRQSPEATFTTLTIKTEQGASILKGQVRYDATALTLLGVNSLTPSAIAEASVAEEGLINFGLVSNGVVQGEVLELVFSSTRQGATASLVSLSSVSEDDLETEASLATEGTFREDGLKTNPLVSAESAELIAAAVTSPPVLKVEFANYPLGDFNSNAKVTLLDALRLTIALLTRTQLTDYQLYHSDISGNGTINFEDIKGIIVKAVNPNLAAALRVAPKEVTLDAGAKGLVLIGNAGNKALPAVTTSNNPESLPVTITDTTPQNAFGKVYELTATRNGNGTVTFDAEMAGKREIIVSVGGVGETLTLQPGGTVTGIDGISIQAPEGAITEPLPVSIVKVDDPSNEYPLSNYVDRIGSFYRLSAARDAYFPVGKDMVLGIPVRDGVSTNNLALAVLVPTKLIKDSLSSQSYQWVESFGFYDTNNKVFIVANPYILKDGEIFALVSGEDFDSLPLAQATDIQPNIIVIDATFGAKCVGFAVLGRAGECTPALERIVAQKLKDTYQKFKGLGFIDPKIPGSNGAKFLITIKPSVSVTNSNVGECEKNGQIENLGGFTPRSFVVCYGNGSTDHLLTVVHEYFHATQFAYNKDIGGPGKWGSDQYNGHDNDWFWEGTAALSENSGTRIVRANRLFHKIDTLITEFNKTTLSHYEAQDFWAFLGLRDGFNFQYLIRFLTNGVTPSVINENVAGGLPNAYWEWAKNQVYEHSVDIGSNALGASCAFNTATVKSSPIPQTFNPANGQSQDIPVGSGSIDILTSNFFELNLIPKSDKPYTATIRLDGANTALKVKYYEKGKADCSSNANEKNDFQITVPQGSSSSPITVYVLLSNTDFQNSFTQSLTLQVSIIEAKLTATPTSVEVDETVSFDATASSGTGGITNYKFDFGDGTVTSNTTGIITHSYSTPGIYFPTVVVTDSTNQTSEPSEPVEIEVKQKQDNKDCQNGNNPDCGDGGSNGDPHLRTLDGLYYDFQGVGEFTLLKSLDDEFEIQTRQAPWGDRTDVSLNSGVALRVGTDRVAIYIDQGSILYINGSAVNLSNTTRQLSDGGSIAENGGRYTVTWKDTSQLRVSFRGPFLELSLSLRPERQGRIIGLLGNYDGNRDNDLSTRDGTVLSTKPSFEELYQVYGNSWRIKQEESLFDYFGEASELKTLYYTDLNFPRTVATVPADKRAEAERICRAAGVTDPILLEACILDVALTGDSRFADGYRDVTPPEGVVATPTAPPVISVTSPANNALVGSNVLVRGNLSLQKSLRSLAYSLNDGATKDITAFLVNGIFAFTIPGQDFTEGANRIRMIAEDMDGTRGSFLLNLTYDPNINPIAGGDLVVFNDLNIFDNARIGRNDNQQLVRNLVTFSGSGGIRDSSRVVAFDRGRKSVCGTSECGDRNLSSMRSVIAAEGYSLVELGSSQGTLTNIPQNIRVIVLWLPLVEYTVTEINTLKQFAAEGGRIIFMGEREPYYNGSGRGGFAIQNQFLKNMGADLTNIGGDINCGDTSLPTTSIRTSQITTNVTRITVNCSSSIQLGPNDYALFYDTTNTIVLAGVAAIDVTPINQMSPLTSTSNVTAPSTDLPNPEPPTSYQ